MSVFSEVALPYFERWRSLAAIDAELNNNPSEPTSHRSLAWFRCSTGIIVAKLMRRADYEQLTAFYTNVMIRDTEEAPFYRARGASNNAHLIFRTRSSNASSQGSEIRF